MVGSLVSELSEGREDVQGKGQRRDPELEAKPGAAGGVSEERRGGAGPRTFSLFLAIPVCCL